MDDYTRVAHIDEIAVDQTLRVEVDGDHILLARLDNELFAINDTCTHEDASLYQGSLHGEYVHCPLHGSRFSIKTGCPIEEPAEEPVATYPVCIKDDWIWIGPADPPRECGH